MTNLSDTTTLSRIYELSKELPGISYGYHGNLTPRYDDRSWHVYLPNPDNGPSTYADRVWVSNVAQEANNLSEGQWAAIEAQVRRAYAAKPGRAEAAARIKARQAELLAAAVAR